MNYFTNKTNCHLLSIHNSVKQFRCKYGTKRKYPVNKKDQNELPVFQYPFASTADRRVYTWGLGNTGALGIKHPEKSKSTSLIKYPSRLHFAEKHSVTNIACGYGFSLLAVRSSTVKLYGTGINTDSQIGYHPLPNGSTLELLVYPSPIILPLVNPEQTKIMSVAAGRAHSLVLTDKEGTFTMGNNAYGQCGRVINNEEIYGGSKSMAYHIPNIKGEDITSICCGQDHSLFVSRSGKVYACGWGADGQTGLGHYNVISEPTQVLGDISREKIIKTSCTADCVLALNDKGEVFGWGNSEYGQLPCHGDNQQINIPQVLPNCNKFGRIIDIASGGSSCLILNENGEVFVWGYGLLGKGPEVQRISIPTQIPSILFGQNNFNVESRVVKIECGMGHYGATTNQGDLYMWGRNKHSCLGLGHKNDQYFPFKVAIGAQVLKLSCGIDHSMALCKPFI